MNADPPSDMKSKCPFRNRPGGQYQLLKAKDSLCWYAACKDVVMRRFALINIAVFALVSSLAIRQRTLFESSW